MKKTIISLLAAGFFASAASAQLYIVEGGTTGVVAEFTFTIDDVANTVTVDIDNTIAGVGGATGSITGFGFNVPAGIDIDLITFTATGGAGFVSTSWVDGFFDLEPGFDQDYGVTGSPQPDTIQFGTTAQFVFSFNQDFTGTDGFLGTNALSVRFQAVVDSQGVTGQSDKVFGNPDEGGGGGPGGSVPEPSTYGMFGALALLGMMVVRQVRRR
jgi:hypothetical protein